MLLIPKCNICPLADISAEEEGKEDNDDGDDVLLSMSELVHKQRTTEVIQQLNNFVDVRWRMVRAWPWPLAPKVAQWPWSW